MAGGHVRVEIGGSMMELGFASGKPVQGSSKPVHGKGKPVDGGYYNGFLRSGKP